jgi:hypothetical protein
MEEPKILIDMTPFVYEDLVTYHFRAVSRDSGDFVSNFCDLEIFENKITEKIETVTTTTGWWLWKTEIKKVTTYNTEEKILIATETLMRTSENDVAQIKNVLRNGLKKHLGFSLDGWDGFVGNIPEDIKTRMSRNSKIKDLLNED